MDRRQKKTRNAIFLAFRHLLEQKRYDHITVQEIIDEADVGRSTFYAHFETKDLLLDALCQDLFEHIFEKDPCPWAGKEEDLEGKLAHILWHVRDNRKGLARILLSCSGDLFMSYFKARLREVFALYIQELPADVPPEFRMHVLTGSFAEAVQWWIGEGMQTPPETMAHHFLQLIEKHS